jgi:KDO2-lipid IV(A) lauroyltransferase
LTVAQPPHAPAPGPRKGLLGRFHGTGVFWFRAAHHACRLAPAWIVPVFEPAIRWAYYLLWGSVRRALASNLEAVLGPCGPRERRRRVHRTLKAFGLCQYDRHRALAGRPQRVPEFAGMEHWNAVMESDRGAILVTAHIGGWELGSAMPTSFETRRVHVVREREMDPAAQEFVESTLERLTPPGYVTHFLDDSAASRDIGFELTRLLRAGEIVAVQGDRPRTGGRTVKGELFGRPYDFPLGPALLAHAGQVPMLPVFSHRLGVDRYRLTFHPPIEPASKEEVVRRLGLAIEEAIRAAPEQWFCFVDLWGQGSEGT